MATSGGADPDTYHGHSLFDALSSSRTQSAHNRPGDYSFVFSIDEKELGRYPIRVMQVAYPCSSTLRHRPLLPRGLRISRHQAQLAITLGRQHRGTDGNLRFEAIDWIPMITNTATLRIASAGASTSHRDPGTAR